jgi:tripartite-type tricarboxylate transporter receptor subunit TctC
MPPSSRLRRRIVSAAGLAFAVPGAQALAEAQANSAPAREPDGDSPLKILVGYSAGGTSDLAARLIAQRIEAPLGRPVVVENKPGAAGRIAAESFTHARPDGNTLMLVPVLVPVLAPFVFTHLGYDPSKDFVPVSQVASYQFGLAVGADHPARNVAELGAWMQGRPDKASFGVVGLGGLPHFFGILYGRELGLQIQPVVYKGMSTMMGELMNGQLPSAIDALSELSELHRAGKIRILASSGTERSPLLPKVPTFKEEGFLLLQGSGWIGMYAPARTPTATIDRMSNLIATTIQAPELRQKMIAMGYEPTGTSADQLAAVMAADAAHWGPIIKASGFHAD